MSSTGQIIGGIVGGVIGFFTGNPLLGVQIGMTVGGLLDPPKVLGPRLSDLTAQTSTYGAFIPRLYGTVAVAGNLFWIQGNRLIEKEADSGGKGGPTVTEFEYFASFAVGLCEGPIDGVRRIWIGGQLWYDAGAGDLTSIIASNEKVDTFTLYTGTDTQLADPLIQADHGVANVPAYRGLAYIVFNELPLKAYGNSLAQAQIKVEVVMSGAISAALVNKIAVPADAAWHTTYGAPGNQYDAQGVAHYVAALAGSPWAPQWVRVIGDDVSVTPLIHDDGEGTPASGSVHSMANSLNTLQYCYGRLDSRYAVWGKGGIVSPEYDCGSGWQANAFAEGGGYAYLIKQPTASADYTLVRLPFNDKIIAEIATGTPIYSLLATWNGDALVFYRTDAASAPLEIKVYREAGGVLGLLNTYTVNLSEPSYLIDTRFSIGHVVGDTLTLISKISATSATIIQINLSSMMVTKKLTVTADLSGLTTALNANLQVIGNLVLFGQKTSSVSTRFHGNTWNLASISPDTIPLSSIVQSECLKSDLLTAADLDVTELTDPVRGYRVSSLAPLRGGIDPLRKAWPFDAIQQGYKIKFKKRGGASVATITESELDAREAGASPGVQVSNVREMDLVLPRQLTAQYLDAVREYDVNVAEESRQ